MRSTRTEGSIHLALLVAGLLLLPAGIAVAAEHSQHGSTAHSMGQKTPDKPAPAAKGQATGDPYLLDKDMVSDQKIEKAVVITFEGRELRFASEDSVKTFKAAPARYLAKIDAAMVEQQLPHYPLDKCVVSGEALGGDMGKPMDYVYKNRLVRFCCEMCKAKFDKDPARYLAKLNEAAIARQKDSYPLQTCPISGEKLGTMGKPVDHVVGNRLVRFCCAGCIAKFDKDPLPSLAKLDGAGPAEVATAGAPHDHSQTHAGHGH